MIRRTFESLGQLIDQVEATRPTTRSIFDVSFVGRGFRAWREVFVAARSAWPKGADEIRKLAAELEHLVPPPLCRKRKLKWDDSNGDEIDIDRLRDMNDRPWRSVTRQDSRGPRTVVLVVNVSALGAVNWTKLKWRGITAVALADILEKAGFAVEIHIARAATLYGELGTMAIDCCIKRASDPVVVDTLATAVSTWFFRTVLLQANELFGGKYGASSTIPIAGLYDELAGRDAKLVEVENVSDASAAADLMRRVLKEVA